MPPSDGVPVVELRPYRFLRRFQFVREPLFGKIAITEANGHVIGKTVPALTLALSMQGTPHIADGDQTVQCRVTASVFRVVHAAATTFSPLGGGGPEPGRSRRRDERLGHRVRGGSLF
jgi:hypothetical protein